MGAKSKKPKASDVTIDQSGGVKHSPPNVHASADTPMTRSSGDEVSEFVAKVKAMAPRQGTKRGRLLFAIDATMSRQPTWDMAQAIQSEMFQAVEDVGGLDVQLIYFRGAGECRASKWVSKPDELARLMTTVQCRGGYTQIGKMLSHAIAETGRRKIDAVVYVGDCMEENADQLCGRAGELGLRGVPLFLFQEGYDGVAEAAFREMARLTKGAWCRFDAHAAAQLRELLTAVAVYAAGGRKALQQLLGDRQEKGARMLLAQLPPSES
ncbi:MAG: VWA domain-containing protein [Hyphomicrobiaceae bacterium]